ncbi:MAG: CocE/NonD family hydrolase [Acutalibacter sp.]
MSVLSEEDLELRQKVQEYEASGFPQEYSSFTVEDLFVPMSDGVMLHTTMYRPAGVWIGTGDAPAGDRFPVILQRTCYPSQAKLLEIHGQQLAMRGYVFVFQYCRGIEESQGVWEPNVNERQDGIDTVNWLFAQPWAGPIGYWGCSYLAATGWAMADAVTGKVRSMALSHYGTDRFKSAYEKGMFRQDVLTSWSMGNCGWEVHADYDAVCRYLPQAEVDTALWGGEVPWYREYVTNTRKSDPYWQQGWWKQLDEIPEHIQIPVFVIEGWYDHHLGSSMNSWAKLGSKDHSWLTIGPWNHGFQPCVEGLPLENLQNSEVRMFLEWFDLTLKQEALPKPLVRTYQIGEDRWTETPSWEEKPVHPETIHLNFAQGTLQASPAQEAGSVPFIFDPADPVPSHGSESCLATWAANGSLLQPEPGSRPDVITLVSQPLERDLRITGKIQAQLWVATDGEDTAFTAKLMRVTPEGKAYNIRSSITTISQGSPAGEHYQPGSPVPVKLDMWDVCYTVKAGERLRLDMSSSDYPNFHIHCNYRGVWGLQRSSRKAVQTLFSGEDKDSWVRMEVQDDCPAAGDPSQVSGGAK